MKRLFFRAFAPGVFLLALSACLDPSGSNIANLSPNSSPTPTSTSTTTAPSAVKAVKIIFKRSSTSGSFDDPVAAGYTPVNSVGQGWPVKRVFNPDGSLLANGGPGSTNWPTWIASAEIGLSGGSNAGATNGECAKFAVSGEGATNCNFGAGATACGGPTDYYRVSEWDCVAGSASNGNGGPSDGVYIRVNLNRASIGTGENLMAVLEYSASGLNSPPVSPSSCYDPITGAFKPELSGCSDMTWRAYLKHAATDVLMPFLLLIPPNLATVNLTSHTAGAATAAKQFILPIASDQAITEFQISRIAALSSSANFTSTCSSAGVGDSPLCVGVVFYSLTLYRI